MSEKKHCDHYEVFDLMSFTLGQIILNSQKKRIRQISDII